VQVQRRTNELFDLAPDVFWKCAAIFRTAFDLLAVAGKDLRHWPLVERKACRRDLEGIVGKWRDGRYEPRITRSFRRRVLSGGRIA